MIIYGQCNDTTMTKLALGENYASNCNAGNLVNFLQRLIVICYESDDGGLSHKPYKIAVAVKSLHNYSNLKPNNPHRFKEELKVKYEATLAVVGKFLDGKGVMEQFPKEDGGQTWIDYCGMTPADQLIWEEKADTQTKAMYFLMDSKNKITKKDLCLAFTQSNHSVYPETIESMARFIS